jgi:small subunit ribosomal protein S26e
MAVKRRNGGRSKKNRGHVKPVVCSNCGRLVGKDKAIKRYTVRDIVDASSRRDIKEVMTMETLNMPKLYVKLQYCVSCAIHARIVRVRSVEDRKNRAPPKRVRPPQDKSKAPAAAAGAATNTAAAGAPATGAAVAPTTAPAATAPATKK